MKTIFMNKEIALFYLAILCFSFLWMNRVESMENNLLEENFFVYENSK